MVKHPNSPPRHAKDSASRRRQSAPPAVGDRARAQRQNHSTTTRAAATTRRPATGSPPATSPTGILARSYKRSDGTERRVLIAVDENDKWLVYDVPSPADSEAEGQLVEHLIGCDDHLGQALALAADYLQCQTAFHAAEREDMPCPDPLPKPQLAPLALIRRLAARARRVVCRGHSQQPAAPIAA
jgi:hypothetical protein